jgi:hypothetical protein
MMNDEYSSLEEYFAEHPDEEADFYDDMAFLEEHDPMELPEDWTT